MGLIGEYIDYSCDLVSGNSSSRRATLGGAVALAVDGDIGDKVAGGGR